MLKTGPLMPYSGSPITKQPGTPAAPRINTPLKMMMEAHSDRVNHKRPRHSQRPQFAATLVSNGASTGLNEQACRARLEPACRIQFFVLCKTGPGWGHSRRPGGQRTMAAQRRTTTGCGRALEYLSLRPSIASAAVEQQGLTSTPAQ